MQDNLSEYSKVRVVIGNPTCDLDSAVCALAYGYFQHKLTEENNIKVARIPVLNIHKQEFRLKTEVNFYLRRCNIPRDLLTFR